MNTMKMIELIYCSWFGLQVPRKDHNFKRNVEKIQLLNKVNLKDIDLIR